MELDTRRKNRGHSDRGNRCVPAEPFSEGYDRPVFRPVAQEEPVHYCRESHVGPYWSITKFDDIMAVDTNHKVFSSEAKLGGIAIQDMHSVEGALELEMFIAMDPPKHDQQRKAVTSAVAPSNLQLLEPTIREARVTDSR